MPQERKGLPQNMSHYVFVFLNEPKNAVGRSSPLRHVRPSIAPPEVSKDIRANGLFTKRVMVSGTSMLMLFMRSIIAGFP